MARDGRYAGFRCQQAILGRAFQFRPPELGPRLISAVEGAERLGAVHFSGGAAHLERTDERFSVHENRDLTRNV